MVIMIRLAPGGPAMLILLAMPAPAQAADWTVAPTLRLRQSYTDNVNLAPAALARGEPTSEIAPGVTITADDGPRLRMALAYSLQKVLYTRQADRVNHQLDASGHAEVLPDWLYLDARSSISQQNISAFGPQLTDTVQVTGNSNQVRAHSISPYLQHYFRGLATAVLRYDYQRVASGSLLGVQSDGASLRLTGDNGGRNWNWNWDLALDRKHIADAAMAPVTMTDAVLTLSYSLNNTLSLFTSGGYEKKDYASRSGEPAGKYWATGATWSPSPRTRVSASFGRRYFGKTYTLDASYRMRSMLWTLNYSEDITTMHGEFLGISPAGLSDFLYQLWETRVPDPQKRLQTIKVFLLISQMLGTDGNVNFFSHRYYLQKAMRLATVYSGTRGALAFNLSTMRRVAQTSSIVDSVLLGPDELALEDRTRQSAAQVGWNWRMSSRGGITVGASHNRVQSLSTGREDRNSVLSATLSHQLRTNIGADVGLRHSRHTSNAGGNYRENGVSAALTVAF
ncbi:MAG TPA: TIGR03016 family PEP-CTERM system-associated outer membrane protein [Duganella sp.]